MSWTKWSNFFVSLRWAAALPQQTTERHSCSSMRSTLLNIYRAGAHSGRQIRGESRGRSPPVLRTVLKRSEGPSRGTPQWALIRPAIPSMRRSMLGRTSDP